MKKEETGLYSWNAQQQERQTLARPPKPLRALIPNPILTGSVLLYGLSDDGVLFAFGHHTTIYELGRQAGQQYYALLPIAEAEKIRLLVGHREGIGWRITSP